MKKVFCIILATALTIGMVASMVGCGDSTENNKETDVTTSEPAEVSESVTASSETTPEETQTELDNTKYFDPFEGVSIECSGSDGDISVEIICDNSYYDETAYSFTGKTEGLSDGDEVTITVSDLAIAQTEESDGLTPTQTTKTFYATADSKYITNANDIPDEFIEEYADYFLNKIYDEYEWLDTYRSASVEYVGYQFAVNEEPSSKDTVSRNKNQLTFVYKASFELSSGIDKTTNEVIWEEYRDDPVTEGLVNLSIGADGTISYESENTFSLDSLKESGYVVLADTTEN